jgi:hypothetical protein
MTKRLFDNAETATLAQQLELEAQLQADATRSEDFVEGVSAFRARRMPSFSGRPRRRHPIAIVVADDRRRWRLTTLLRPVLSWPHQFVVAGWAFVAFVLWIVVWAITLVRGRTPPGLHGFMERFVRYAVHVSAYTYLIADPFPHFRGWRGTYPVDLEIARPARQDRWRTGFRLLLAIPALIFAYVLNLVLQIVFVITWLIALAIGRQPKGLRDLGAYCIRYHAQTLGYLLFLTDRYPSLASNPVSD